MAWTFDVFAFIPACFLLSILTLAPQVASQQLTTPVKTACETCTDPAGAAGSWCLKTYTKADAADIHANFCVPKPLTADSCLGGQLVTKCPKAPLHAITDYSALQPDHLTCTTCQEATGKWCIKGSKNEVQVCVPAAKMECVALVGNDRGSLWGPCYGGNFESASVPAVGASPDNEATCAACVAATGKAWCLKDYGDTKASFCIVPDTAGACLGGTQITIDTDCPTFGADRRETVDDIAECHRCMVTYSQKWCLKGLPGAQFRACVPTADIGRVCTSQGGSSPAACSDLKLDHEKRATKPTEPTEAPVVEIEPPAVTTTTTTKSSASTAGVLTASVLAMLVAAT